MPRKKSWKKTAAAKKQHEKIKAGVGINPIGVGLVPTSMPLVVGHVPTTMTPVSADVGNVPIDVGLVPTSMPLVVGHVPTTMTSVSAGMGLVSLPVTVESVRLVPDSTLATDFTNYIRYKFTNDITNDITNDDEFYTENYSTNYSSCKLDSESQIKEQINVTQNVGLCDHKMQTGSITSELEERPLFIFSDFNQNDAAFPSYSRGMQCTCNALMSIILLRGIKLINSSKLNTVLFEGDELYRTRIAELESENKFVSHLLMFNELPTKISTSSGKYTLHYNETICGTLTHKDFADTDDVLNLREGLDSLFASFNAALILVHGLCSALFHNENNKIIFFDSHSHNSSGLSAAEGKAVCIQFHNIQQLICYLYSYYRSCQIDIMSQFEILPLCFEKDISELLDNDSQNVLHTKTRTSTADQLQKYFDYQSSMQKEKENSVLINEKKQEKRRTYMRSYMKNRRQDRTFKQFQRDLTLTSMKKARLNQVYKQQELAKKQEVRTVEKVKKLERERTLQTMQKARKNQDYRQKELLHKQNIRQDENVKELERERTLQTKKRARKNQDYRKKESLHKQNIRQDENIKKLEQERTLKSMHRARKSRSYKQKELFKKQKVRKDEVSTHKEQIRNLRYKQNARQNPKFVEGERLQKQESRKRHRSTERNSDKSRKRLKRNDASFAEEELIQVKRKRYGNSIDECITMFQKESAVGPIYVCTCCHQTWFANSVRKLISAALTDKDKDVCTGYRSVDNEEWICNTCHSSIKEGKIPRLSVANGMKWPEKPDVLNLHPLEERLVSLRIPFMEIRELPRGGQLSAKGNIVNVPVDIQPTINALPRQLDENVTIAVKLKKRISHKSSVFVENVRPARVIAALEWLMNHSDMYKNSGIQIDSYWQENVNNSSDDVVTELTGRANIWDVSNENEPENDPFCEIQNDSSIEGNADTLLEDANLDTNKIYVFAPGENQKPLGIFQDENFEYLCFPTIFCGQKRLNNDERMVSVSYSDIAKWELRSVDRRAARSVPNIFTKLKKIQAKQVGDKTNFALRRCKTEGKKITAACARDSVKREQIARLNEGYYIFRTLRNSPAYLASRKKDVFAMIRQIGLPTYFISLSSADTRWPDLLKTLANLNEDICTEDEVLDADWYTKSKLVQKDPVTCSRYFDHRVQLFINTVLKSIHHPLGRVTDVFRRVEFQHRGSPHIHMLIWTENTPKYNKDNATQDEIIAFVNKHITCAINVEDPELQELIDLQVHKHSKTCKKKGKSVCRFGFPLPPLTETMLLEPLDTDVDDYKKKYSEIQQKMNDYKDGCSLTYVEFLDKVVELPEDEYIKCIRASLKGPKIFLKREPSEMRVNYYNKILLKAWKANLDIQFVLDPYACAMYIVSYISKSQRGISSMLEKASHEAAQGNMDLRRQVRHIGNKFLNFVEVSAQEASYLVLQMPLTQSSRDVVFINTSPKQDRVFLLKDQSQLEELPPDSTDIEANNMIKRYSLRPKMLENWCLADVISQLEIKFPEKFDKNEENNEDQLDTQDESEFSDEDVLLKLKSGIIIRRRKTQRVIRYVHYSQKTNAENYYREKLMLFIPWRNESTDLLGGFETYEQHYFNKKRFITAKQNQYEHHMEELEQARLQAEDDDLDYDEIAPSTEHAEAEDREEGSVISDEFIHFDPESSSHRYYDIGPDIGLPSTSHDTETSMTRLSDDDYCKLMRSLNIKQREFHNHVVHWIATRKEPIYAFLTGGAGVGKSIVINALYQTLHRVLCSEEGDNPDDVRILLCAITGKAAFNIKGTTIASAFHQKMYQAQQHMHADELNAFRTKYRNLSVIIIDEISMVGNQKLAFIHQRLTELTCTKQDFGGISIIAVGDLFQLSPVCDGWIFNDLCGPGQGFAANLWKKHFKMFELLEIMRQKNDKQFAEFLNRLRRDTMTDEDKLLIKSLQKDKSNENYPKFAPHLFIENVRVDEFNNDLMLSLSSEKVTVNADTDILSSTKLSTDVKCALINGLSKKHTDTGGLAFQLTIAVNMTYDISVNLDVSDGLTNGSTCRVMKIEYKESQKRPAIVWVLFDDFNVGSLRRSQYKHLFSSEVHQSWTPIFETKRTFLKNRRTYERIQFPLFPSAAKTVHKAQGCTVNELVVDLAQSGRNRKNPHIHYVALSRVRTMTNLHILDFNENAYCVDRKVEEEMKRLQSEAQMMLCYQPLYAVKSEQVITIAFNNARSLHKHFEDVQSDPNIQAADIIGFAESWFNCDDHDSNYQLDGFRLFRNDQINSAHRPHHGLACYVKDTFTVTDLMNFSLDKLEFTCFNIEKDNFSLTLIIIYKKPSCSLIDFQSILNLQLPPFIHRFVSGNIVFVGDFNFNIESGNHQFLNYMTEKFSCRQIVEKSTTKYGSITDLIFTNMKVEHHDVLECFWSDHKIIYCAVSNTEC